MSFANRGEGGVPDLGKIPTFFRFLGDVHYLARRMIAEPGSEPSGVGDGGASRLSQEYSNMVDLMIFLMMMISEMMMIFEVMMIFEIMIIYTSNI